MMAQTYFGLENEGDRWLLVQRSGGKTVFLRDFINTMEGLNDLVKCIKNHCVKPKIFIKATGSYSLGLLKYLCGIPDIEVMLVSPAGFRQYRTCLPKGHAVPVSSSCCEAEMLADCAERMI